MKIQKKEIVYSGLLMINIFIIYNTFYAGFSDVIISRAQEESILLLTLNRYIYMFAGLILTSFTAYLYMNMSSYKVGKIFSVYIAMVSIGLCLIAATNHRYMSINILIGLLAFISNFVLFYLIGCLTLVFRKEYFKWMMKGYTFLTACVSIFYLICVVFNHGELNDVYCKAITVDYIVTIAAIIISMIVGYKQSTRYSKQQIKFLTIGLASGIIIFVIMHSVPTLAIVTVPEDSLTALTDSPVENTGAYEQTYPEIQIEKMNMQQAIYPIMVFTGIVIVLIYILIKREYFIINSMDDLRCCMVSIVYLVIANTCFHFIISNDVEDFIPFNFILVMPLLLHSYHVCQKGNHLYDNGMLEVLETERQKLSIYLHDEVLQGLTAMLHSVHANDINEELSALIADIRNVSQNLYPTIAEDLGLEEAVKIFVCEINNDYNVETEYVYKYPQGVLPKGISLVLYRAIKELVTNVIKHSGGTRIIISISEVQGGIQGMVLDDGRGFQVPENNKLLKGHHMGLYTIRKQITELNGNMRIISDGTGSEIQIYIPLR